MAVSNFATIFFSFFHIYRIESFHNVDAKNALAVYEKVSTMITDRDNPKEQGMESSQENNLELPGDVLE